jgi:hypothetical protein
MGAEAGRGQVDRYWHTLLEVTASARRPLDGPSVVGGSALSPALFLATLRYGKRVHGGCGIGDLDHAAPVYGAVDLTIASPWGLTQRDATARW